MAADLAVVAFYLIWLYIMGLRLLPRIQSDGHELGQRAVDTIFYQRTVNLLEADLGDELVALDAAGGNCFGFNSVATGVWRHLVSPKSFNEIEEALLAEYAVDRDRCRAELRELLDDLVEKGLVRKVARSAGVRTNSQDRRTGG